MWKHIALLTFVSAFTSGLQFSQRAAAFSLVQQQDTRQQTSDTPDFQEMKLAKKQMVIPFTLASTQILVDDVYVNGKGPFRFMLDTGGMGGGRIDSSLVKKLGLERSGTVTAGDGTARSGREMDVFQLESLSIPGLEFKGVQVLSRDYNEHGFDVRGHIDGILGFGLFKDVLLTIDYSTRELNIERGSLPEPDGKRIFSTSDNSVAEVEIKLGGRAHKAYLDTGAMSWISVSEEIANNMKFVADPVKVGEARTLTGAFPITRGKIKGDLVLGNHVVSQPYVVSGRPLRGVNIGGFVLRDFTITYDQSNRRIKVESAKTIRPNGIPGYARLPRKPVSVEMNISTGHPTISAKINGKGPYKFVLDTGADTILLNDDLAEELGLSSNGKTRIGDPSNPEAVEAKTYQLDSVSVGGAEFGDVAAIGWQGFGRLEVRGVIGISTFYDSVVDLNYAGNQLTIRRGSLGPKEGVSYYLDGGSFLTVDLNLGGKKLKTHIDTGNMGQIALPLSIAKDLQLVSPPTVVGRARTISGEFDIHQATLDGKIDFAGQSIRNPTIHFNDQFDWGNIGSQAMAGFVLTVDQTNQRIKLVRPKQN